MYIAAGGVECLGIGACVDLAEIKSHGGGCIDLPAIGIHERADGHAGGFKLMHNIGEASNLAGDIKTALGGDLLPTFGNQHREGWLQFFRQRNHRVSGRHLQIQFHMTHRGDRFDIDDPEYAGDLPADAW